MSVGDRSDAGCYFKSLNASFKCLTSFTKKTRGCNPCLRTYDHTVTYLQTRLVQAKAKEERSCRGLDSHSRLLYRLGFVVSVVTTTAAVVLAVVVTVVVLRPGPNLKRFDVDLILKG